MASVSTFFNWDSRPAVKLDDGRILAITRAPSDTSWRELNAVSADDVVATAGVLPESAFAKRFPYADLSKIPDKPLPKSGWKEAAERAMWAVEVQRKMKEMHTMPKGRPN